MGNPKNCYHNILKYHLSVERNRVMKEITLVCQSSTFVLLALRYFASGTRVAYFSYPHWRRYRWFHWYQVFGNFRIFSENVRKRSSGLRNNFGKSSESSGKFSENRQKRRYQFVYIIERTLHASSKIWMLCSRGKQYLEHKIHIFSPPCNILKTWKVLHKDSLHHRGTRLLRMTGSSDDGIHWHAGCIVSAQRIISQITKSPNLWKSLSALDTQLQQILKLKWTFVDGVTDHLSERWQ